VAIWLLVGIGMIMIQVLLGGITRLTGSGLSITEWKPILGALPPMNVQEWNTAFEKYKQIAQYKYLNAHFTLSDFKFIFFWEWFHRFMGKIVFCCIHYSICGLFNTKKNQKKYDQAASYFIVAWCFTRFSWMDYGKSGLEDSELLFVSHYKLAIHFILALGLLCYVLWLALDLLIPKEQLTINKPLRKFTNWLIGLLIIQLIYGAFMAGLKAAATAPTWPTINGVWIPSTIHSFGDHHFTGLSYLTDHPLIIHFIHRNLAYLISILVFIWSWKAYMIHGTKLFQKTKWLPLFIVLLQVLLGILTVLNAINQRSFLWLAVAHQFVAMILLLSLIWILYIVRKKLIVAAI
jgi:cytochrome c oxidase assembly protein subunit 15